MEDMTAKIKELLSDEESMKQINELAQMFTSEEKASDKEMDDTENAGQSLPFDVERFIKIQSMMNNAGGGEAAALLMALKPLLKKERRERVDRAVKILKLLAVAKFMKENGMLNDLL